MNNRYTVSAESPLIRPGVVISTEVSKRYVVATVAEIMDLIREVNTPPIDGVAS